MKIAAINRVAARNAMDDTTKDGKKKHPHARTTEAWCNVLRRRNRKRQLAKAAKRRDRR